MDYYFNQLDMNHKKKVIVSSARFLKTETIKSTIENATTWRMIIDYDGTPEHFQSQLDILRVNPVFAREKVLQRLNSVLETLMNSSNVFLYDELNMDQMDYIIFESNTFPLVVFRNTSDHEFKGISTIHNLSTIRTMVDINYPPSSFGSSFIKKMVDFIIPSALIF